MGLRELNDRFVARRENRARRRWDRRGPRGLDAQMFRHPIVAAAVQAGFFFGLFVVDGLTPAVLLGTVFILLHDWARYRQAGRFLDRWRRDREAQGIEVTVPRRPSALEAVGLAVVLGAMGAMLVWVHGADDGPCAGDLELAVDAAGGVDVNWTARCSEPVWFVTMITYRATGSADDDLVPGEGPFETTSCEDAVVCELGTEVSLGPGQCVDVLSLLSVHRHGNGPTFDRATDRFCRPA